VMAPPDYEQWQLEAAELASARIRPSEYGARMAAVADHAEHLDLRLRPLLDAADGDFKRHCVPPGNGGERSSKTMDAMGVDTKLDEVVHPDGLPDVDMFLGEAGPHGGVYQAPPELSASMDHGGVLVKFDDSHNHTALDGFDAHDCSDGGAAAQDARTAQVGRIVLDCLNGPGSSIIFSDLAPVAGTDKATAACTFAALLALTTANRLHVNQERPYEHIRITAPR